VRRCGALGVGLRRRVVRRFARVARHGRRRLVAWDRF
jgi:hypothetical protein